MKKPSLGFKLFSFLPIPQTLTSIQSRLIRRSLSAAGNIAGDTGGAMTVKKVTLSNFTSVLEDLRTRIRESDFVAVDLEMTGMKSAPWRESFEFDRSDVRFLKIKDSAEKFAVVQFGLCIFKWDASQSSFIAHPLNFYIFPRKEQSIEGPTTEFLCQTSSISFLAKHQFDFNACIREGISYLSKRQEEVALQNLCSAYENGLGGSSGISEEYAEIPAIRTADLLFTERMKIRFREWRESVLKYPKDHILEGNQCGPDAEFNTVFFKMHPAIMLNGFTSHRIKLIQLVVRKYFKELLFVSVIGENCLLQKLVVYTDSEEDKAFLMKEIQEDKLRSEKLKIQSAVGFRHVIDLLMSEKKLIVGHNCFLDIAHIYYKFIGPLPFSMEEFVLSVNKIFPNIIDTKHLITSNQVIQYFMKASRKSLSSAFSVLCPKILSDSQNSASHSFVKVDVQTDEPGSSYWSSGAKHEAGFDAFMTGCVFAQACSHLGIKFEQNSLVMDLPGNDKLKGYMNILYPSWSNGTVIDLTTGTETSASGHNRKNPKIEFDKIALLWGFSSKIKPKDIEECMRKFFGQDSVTSVFFLDKTAAFVQFNRTELVNELMVLKNTLEKEDGLISVLHPFSKLLEGGNTRVADYELYKEICSSSMSEFLFADQAEATAIRRKSKISPVSLETSSSEHQILSKSDSDIRSGHLFYFEEMLSSL